MRIIEHNLLPKQKARKTGLNVKIDLYDYASELYDELDTLGIINRVKEVPQLGLIKVPKKLMKTRYDYTLLQLYFHHLIKKNIQSKLLYSYNNYLNTDQFPSEFRYSRGSEKATIADLIQILTIVYNIGHFYNTFTASRSVIMLATDDHIFRENITCCSSDEAIKEAAQQLIDNCDYQHLHLLNSLLILEHCDASKMSVKLAKSILLAYINPNILPEKSKIRYAFDIFKNVRNVSYIAYDVQIANTPITIDLWNEKAILLLLEELLSSHNDNTPAHNLVFSLGKLLDDTVYNNSSDAICYYGISRRIVSKISQKYGDRDFSYYEDFFLDRDNEFNKIQRHTKDHLKGNILKLTFPSKYRCESLNLLLSLERINNTRVGYYDRHTGGRTILVSIKQQCTDRRHVAFRILKTVISFLRSLPSIESSDVRYLLASKFFLFYFFNEKPLIIQPTIDENICVLCARGKNRRISEISKIQSNDYGDVDSRHEAEFLKKRLSEDTVNDTSILIPGSIQIFHADSEGKKLREFDGMIIHPMRKSEQIVLLESKNRDEEPSLAKKCLSDKLDALEIDYPKGDIEIDGYDSYLVMTI
ncbi:hypothetical protein MASR2M70_00450 [Bacillota bacterium]